MFCVLNDIMLMQYVCGAGFVQLLMQLIFPGFKGPYPALEGSSRARL